MGLRFDLSLLIPLSIVFNSMQCPGFFFSFLSEDDGDFHSLKPFPHQYVNCRQCVFDLHTDTMGASF